MKHTYTIISILFGAYLLLSYFTVSMIRYEIPDSNHYEVVYKYEEAYSSKSNIYTDHYVIGKNRLGMFQISLSKYAYDHSKLHKYIDLDKPYMVFEHYQNIVNSTTETNLYKAIPSYYRWFYQYDIFRIAFLMLFLLYSICIGFSILYFFSTILMKFLYRLFYKDKDNDDYE